MHNCLIVKIRVLGRVFHLLLVAIELNVPRELFSSIAIELNFVLGGGHGFRNTILFVPHNRNKKNVFFFFFFFCFVLFCFLLLFLSDYISRWSQALLLVKVHVFALNIVIDITFTDLRRDKS